MLRWVDARAAGPQRWGRWLFVAFLLAEVALIALTRLTAAAPNGGDLCRDFVDAQRLLHGQDPYAPFASCGDLHHSPHPPLALLLVVPLAWLPIGAAAFVWDLLMLAALGGALWLVWDELRPQVDPRWVAVGLAVILVWTPLQDTWLEAQIGPLVLLLLVLAWRARRHGQAALAGGWLAVATLIRVYPVLLFAYPLLRREWRLARGGVIVGGVITLVTLPLFGVPSYLRYLFVEAPGASAEWVNDAHNVAWRGWLGSVFVGSNTIHPLLAAAGVVGPLFGSGVVVALAALLWRGWNARAAVLGTVKDDAVWLLGIPVMLLVSPLAWPHYFTVLLLPWLVVLADAARARRMTPSAWLVVAAVTLTEVHALGLRVLLPLPRLLPWPAGVFVFMLPFYALLLSFFAVWCAVGQESGEIPKVLREK
ncbi:MAG: DUF2029 domain-containing protein [Ktedonobacterales bacterium]|nr:DUF2029 domain-containing protein [Ktedonobacterales bacterium]